MRDKDQHQEFLNPEIRGFKEDIHGETENSEIVRRLLEPSYNFKKYSEHETYI